MKFSLSFATSLLACLCAIAAGPLGAEEPIAYDREPQGLEQDFLMRVWETADGLLPTNVRSITQSRDGYLWLAAFDGFVRFDGTRATLFSGKNVAELPGAESGPGFCRLDGTVLGCDFGWTLVFS